MWLISILRTTTRFKRKTHSKCQTSSSFTFYIWLIFWFTSVEISKTRSENTFKLSDNNIKNFKYHQLLISENPSNIIHIFYQRNSWKLYRGCILSDDFFRSSPFNHFRFSQFQFVTRTAHNFQSFSPPGNHDRSLTVYHATTETSTMLINK